MAKSEERERLIIRGWDTKLSPQMLKRRHQQVYDKGEKKTRGKIIGRKAFQSKIKPVGPKGEAD